MVMSIAEPVAGHRAKYNHLTSIMPAKEAGELFVGGSDPAVTGFIELEILRRFKRLEGTSICDVGCGIGRLTKYLAEENISRYIGLDVVAEILEQAEQAAKGLSNFEFAVVDEARLPAETGTFDFVCGFSLITHLLDEEIFEYFREAKRVLSPGGFAIFSFLDLDVPRIRETFFQHAKAHRHGHGDLLRFTTRQVLKHLAAGAGLKPPIFFDGDDNVVTPMMRSTLIDGRPAPTTGSLGQSICIMPA